MTKAFIVCWCFLMLICAVKLQAQIYARPGAYQVTREPSARAKLASKYGRNSDIEDWLTNSEVGDSDIFRFRAWFRSILSTYDNRLRPQFGVAPLTIKLGLILIGISSISEGSMEFTVEMFLHETWTDERLTYDPSEVGGKSPLTMPLDAPRTFWTPDTTFLNARKSKAPEEGSVSHLYYMKLHANGTMSYSRRLSITAECQMDLTMYPFDQQACSLEISSYGWTVEDVMYEWALSPQSIRLEMLLLPDFEPLNYAVKVFNRSYVAGHFSIAKFCVVLKRRSGFCFLQLFVPATAVVGSSWISLWLESETQFSDMVAVILAIIFLSYSYNTVMPKVSYIKAMDIYLGACFIFAFLSLVKLAIVKYMHKRVTKRKEQHQEEMLASNSASRLPTAVVISSADENVSEEVVHLLTLDSGVSETPQTTPLKKPVTVSQAGRRLTVAPMVKAPSQMSVNRDYHDRYWRCMKAFHFISQLTLPLAFGAFGIFYFFIYPNVKRQAVC